MLFRSNGKKSSATTFYNLDIVGNNTSTASSLTIENKLFLSSSLTDSAAHTITILSDDTSALSGNGKIYQGKVVRTIANGSVGKYRFHSLQTSVRFHGVGTTPVSISIARYPDSTTAGEHRFRIEKSGSVDTVNNAFTVDSVTHFSKWVFGQVGHKDSTGGPLYELDSEEPAVKGKFSDVASLTLEYNPSSLTYREDSVALYRITDRKSTRLNSSHVSESRMPSSA